MAKAKDPWSPEEIQKKIDDFFRDDHPDVDTWSYALWHRMNAESGIDIEAPLIPEEEIIGMRIRAEDKRKIEAIRNGTSQKIEELTKNVAKLYKKCKDGKFRFLYEKGDDGKYHLIKGHEDW